MNINYHMRDFYDWDPNDTDKIGTISPAMMYELHGVGLAKDYKIEGTVNLTITWTQGNVLTIEDIEDMLTIEE